MLKKMLSKIKQKQADQVDETNEKNAKEDHRPLSFPSLVDNMLNEGITFHKDHFEIQTGLGTIKYGRSFFIKPSGYPRTVRIGWLDSLFGNEDVDVSVHIDPFDRTSAIKKLQDKIDELDTVKYSAQKRGDEGQLEDAMQKLEDTKFLQRQIKNNRNGLYYVSVQATVYADSLEELNAKCVEIESEVGGESIELLNAYERQKQGFLSTLPIGKNFLPKSDRNLDQLSLTAIFPHSSSKLNHTGDTMPIGRYGNEYVWFNNFDRKLNNYNVGIFGESGAGKGVMVKQLIGRGPMSGITRHIILDVEPEYIALTEALGGVVIPIRATKDPNANRINPLDIYPEKEVQNKGQADEYVIEKIRLNEKIKELIEFFKVMKESCSPGSQGLNPVETGVLNDILEDLYLSRGITEDPDSIYESVENIDSNGEIVWERRYIEMPTISDVYHALEKKREQYEELKELCNVVKLFTREKAFGMFDGQTNINMGYDVSLDDAPIITFDISKLSANGIERPLAQHVLMTWTWSKFITSDPKRKKRVIVDEAWMMLKYQAMMDWLKLLSARGRKWNTSLTLVSQRYEMFHRTESARDVIAQLNTVFFMKQSDEDIAPILETFHFAPEVGEMIRTADTGDVIMKAGKEIVAFRSEPTPDEWAYLNTNMNVDLGGEVQKDEQNHDSEIFAEAVE